MSLENLKSIEGLDVAQGLVNCMDDEGLYLSIISMYIEQLNEYLPKLVEHYESANWEEYGKLAHSIKGASASVGTHVIQALSADLEGAAKQQNFAPIINKHQEYYDLLVTTIDQLQQSL